MDELHAFAGTKQVTPETAEAPTGKHWVHCSMARASRLLIAVAVGPRTAETAEKLVKNTASRLAPESWPRWCSDAFEPYVAARFRVFHLVLHYLRTRRRGRPRKPPPIAHPQLRYGQVVKHRRGRRLMAITKRVITGVAELVPLEQLSTSLLERLNGTLRLHVSPMRRPRASLCQMSRRSQSASAVVQELLQPLPCAFRSERSDPGTSSRADGSSMERARVANFRRFSYFKDHVGSTHSCGTSINVCAPRAKQITSGQTECKANRRNQGEGFSCQCER